MFWADELALKLKERKLPLEWVDDMKTPSGRIHIGALRGVVVHDLAFKALTEAEVKAKYTYVFDNHDPMDGLPVYLPREKYEKYLGMPLYKIPSPEKGHESFASYYAEEFREVFNKIGCQPEIIWATELYESGRVNDLIKECLDKTDIIKGIYKELYKRELANDWYPFQVYCEGCGKVSTTKVGKWDGEKVSYECRIEGLDWTKGCGKKSSVSPFSSKGHVAGKLPWKIEWAVKWKIIGVTVEGAGKDHMSKGGSHDLASLICKKVIDYPVPHPIPYEWFLVGGRKMSTSKGVGSSAGDMLEILPPELLRFLMVKTKINEAINFDPEGETIPKLFDEYYEYADHFFSGKKDDYARAFELSQLGEPEKPPAVKFSTLAQWVQMPNMEQKIKEEGAEKWAKYAKVWVEKYAPDEERFEVKKDLPEKARELSEKQKEYLVKLSEVVGQTSDPEELQTRLYELSKETGLSTKDAFAAIYTSLLGKSYGPKAAWLINSLDREFVKKRFVDASKAQGDLGSAIAEVSIRKLNNPEVFSIDKNLAQAYPSISVGVAVIKGVSIKKQDPKLEEEKNKLLKSFKDLTTEELGELSEVKCYRRFYKEMGVDWHSRRPSPEALLRRVALKKGLYTINTCVDAYNLVVMKHRVSIGAFDLDKIKMPTVLRFAHEGEEILLLGDSEPTKYTSKEIAYFDQEGGFNLDFNYRDAQRTAVQLETKNLYINVDGVFDITPEQVEKSLEEACDKIIEYCGGTLEIFGVETAS